MNEKISLALLIAIMILICGCVMNNEISSDDRYLKSVDDFLFQNDQTYNSYYQQAGISPSPDQTKRYETEIKNLSITFYNRVAPLSVSSKFEFSKTTFLQALKEKETVADFLIRHPEDPLVAIADSSLTTAEKAQYFEINKHNENYTKFFLNIFDGNICYAAREKFPNITYMCNQRHP